MTCTKYKEPIKYTKHKHTQENTRPTIKRGPQVILSTEILSTTEIEYMSESSSHKSKLKFYVLSSTGNMLTDMN